MMGDTNVQTVMRHYFNLDIRFMAEMIDGWSVPPVISPDDTTESWTNQDSVAEDLRIGLTSAVWSRNNGTWREELFGI